MFIALDVSVNTPTIAIALPGRRIGEPERVGKLQVHKATSILDGLVPVLDVDSIISGDATTARTNKVHIDVVNTPRREHIRLRLSIRIRAWLCVVNGH